MSIILEFPCIKKQLTDKRMKEWITSFKEAILKLCKEIEGLVSFMNLHSTRIAVLEESVKVLRKKVYELENKEDAA